MYNNESGRRKNRLLLELTKKWKRNWLGHWLRRNCLLKGALEGMVNGKKVRDRRRYHIIDIILIKWPVWRYEKEGWEEGRVENAEFVVKDLSLGRTPWMIHNNYVGNSEHFHYHIIFSVTSRLIICHMKHDSWDNLYRLIVIALTMELFGLDRPISMKLRWMIN